MPEDKLQLEAGSVQVKDISGKHRGVSGKEDLTGLTLFFMAAAHPDQNQSMPGVFFPALEM